MVNGFSESSILGNRHENEEKQEDHAGIFHSLPQEEAHNGKCQNKRSEGQPARSEHHASPPGADKDIAGNLVTNLLRVRKWWRLHMVETPNDPAQAQLPEGDSRRSK